MLIAKEQQAREKAFRRDVDLLNYRLELILDIVWSCIALYNGRLNGRLQFGRLKTKEA